MYFHVDAARRGKLRERERERERERGRGRGRGREREDQDDAGDAPQARGNGNRNGCSGVHGDGRDDDEDGGDDGVVLVVGRVVAERGCSAGEWNAAAFERGSGSPRDKADESLPGRE